MRPASSSWFKILPPYSSFQAQVRLRNSSRPRSCLVLPSVSRIWSSTRAWVAIRVIRTGNPQGVISLHPAPPHQDVLVGFIKGVPPVQLPGDIGRRNDDQNGSRSGQHRLGNIRLPPTSRKSGLLRSSDCKSFPQLLLLAKTKKLFALRTKSSFRGTTLIPGRPTARRSTAVTAQPAEAKTSSPQQLLGDFSARSPRKLAPNVSLSAGAVPDTPPNHSLCFYA